MLFASGMISFFELSHLSYDTEEILKANQRNVELAKEMLGAVHDQNVAIVHLAILQDASYDSLCRTGMQRLEHAVATAQKGALDRSALGSLTAAVRSWGQPVRQQHGQASRAPPETQGQQSPRVTIDRGYLDGARPRSESPRSMPDSGHESEVTTIGMTVSQ